MCLSRTLANIRLHNAIGPHTRLGGHTARYDVGPRAYADRAGPARTPQTELTKTLTSREIFDIVQDGVTRHTKILCGDFLRIVKTSLFQKKKTSTGLE